MYTLFTLKKSSLTSEDLYHLLLEFCIHPYIFFNIKLLLRVNDKSQMYKKSPRSQHFHSLIEQEQ